MFCNDIIRVKNWCTPGIHHIIVMFTLGRSHTIDSCTKLLPSGISHGCMPIIKYYIHVPIYTRALGRTIATLPRCHFIWAWHIRQQRSLLLFPCMADESYSGIHASLFIVAASFTIDHLISHWIFFMVPWNIKTLSWVKIWWSIN